MKKKFTAGAVLVTALALLIFSAASVAGLYFRQLDTARNDLHELLNLLDVQNAQADPAGAAADFHTAAPDKRLTLIAADGSVLADTDSGTGENHAGRPEIQAALASGWGEATRDSATVGVPMLYVAKAFPNGTVGRAAMPVSSVRSLVWASIPPLLVVLVIALSLSYAVSQRVAKQLVKPLEAVSSDLKDVLEGGEATALERYQADDELRSILHYIRLLMDRLREDMRRMKEDESIRSEFTANVSHELKTPLTSIRGSCEMLAKGMVTDPEDQQRFFTLISVEVDRLITLINDILELSELESVSIQQPSETASPLAAAREAEKLLEGEARERGASILVRGEEGEARIAPARLQELLVNLMENALRYGKDNRGRVEVTVSREGERIKISVADDGIGIPQAAQAHVFERFYRVDKGRSRQNGGTGLGLAIVKHIAELYGGAVSLQSRPGAGSTFTVTLPAAFP